VSRWYFPKQSSEQWWLDPDYFQEINLLSTSHTLKAQIEYDPLRTTEKVNLGYGYGVTYVHGGGNRVHISYDMGGDEDAFDRHLALVSSLREGREASFSQNQSDTWAVGIAADSFSERGDTIMNYAATSIFSAYASIDDPRSDTVCLVQSARPELHREIVETGSVNTGLQVFGITGRGSHTGLVYDHNDTDDVDKLPIVRPLLFFPFLRLAPGQKDICKQVNGMNYVFDAWFIVDVGLEHRYIGEGA